VIDEARSSRDGTRAWGIATICVAKGLAGRAGSMPRNVAWASVSSTSGQASSRAHAGAHVKGSVKMGRGPTTVVYLISSSAIREDDTDADASYSGGRRVLGKSRGVGVPAMGRSGGRRGPPRADRSKKRRAPRGGGGWNVVGWEEERVGGHRVATSAESYVAWWWGGVAEANVVGE